MENTAAGPLPGSDGAAAALLAALGGLEIHDVSPTIHPDMPMWFMYGPPTIEPIFTHAQAGAAANQVSLSEHTGTHVDAPFHFDANGLTVDQVPIDTMLLRPYCKFDLTANDHQPGELIGLESLLAAQRSAGFEISLGDVAIIEVGWDRYLPGGPDAREPGWWGNNQPGLAEDACEYLAGAGVVAVASDTAACDVAAKEGELLGVHGHSVGFLPRGILIVEGLHGLADVASTGLFLALPLKIQGGTGSPVRVVLLTE